MQKLVSWRATGGGKTTGHMNAVNDACMFETMFLCQH